MYFISFAEISKKAPILAIYRMRTCFYVCLFELNIFEITPVREGTRCAGSSSAWGPSMLWKI